MNGHATARGLAGFAAGLLDGRLPAGVARPGGSGPDRFTGEEVTWTVAGGRNDGPDAGMGGLGGLGGLGGQWAGARPPLGLAWALLTAEVGDFARVEAVEAALLGVLGA